MKNRTKNVSPSNISENTVSRVSSVDLIENLAHSYALWMRENNELAPAFVEFDPRGLAVALYSNKDKAQAAVEYCGVDDQSIELRPIEPVWDFIVDAASRGFSSLVLNEQMPIRLLNRLSDI